MTHSVENDAPNDSMPVTFDLCAWNEIRDLKYALEDAIGRRGGMTLLAVSDALTTVYMDRATRPSLPDMCHNGHPFEPGVTVDDAPGESHPDWCNVCGEARVIPPEGTQP